MAYSAQSRFYSDVPNSNSPRNTQYGQNSGYGARSGAYNTGSMVARETSAEIGALPLDIRFAKLNQIFTRLDTRDLQEVFPAAVEAVFGFQSSALNRTQYSAVTGQWYADQPYIPVSFCDITQNYRLVYEAGYQLLSSDGPVFRFLVSVSGGRASVSPRFDFPVSCLSYSVRKNLENGVVPPWYRDKVPQNLDMSIGDTTEGPEFISLTAFEFFFAHFAYHLVNPDLRTNNPALPDCLYMALVDNYSTVFFNPTAVLENQRFFSNPSLNAGILRRPQGLFGRSANATLELTSPVPHAHALATSENLECLINVFVEFWLNTSGFTSPKNIRKYPSTPKTGSQGRHSPSFGASPLSPVGPRRRQQGSQNMPTVFPPTCALQAFRQIIKVLHEFIYAPTEERGHHKNMESNLLDIKRHIIPQLVQRPLYEMLKLTMKKYPMDASFRFIYELWLTYLQPWRYENIVAKPPSTEEMIVVSKDQRWNGFVTENLLFYSALFQNFVDRMLRVDFSVPFNTIAVSRVARVFCDTQMYLVIQSIEDLAGFRKPIPPKAGLSPTKTAVKNHFADLEPGLGFVYSSFFSPETAGRVFELLRVLASAQRLCFRKVQESKQVPVLDKGNLQYWIDRTVESVKTTLGLVTGPIVGLQLKPEEWEKMETRVTKGMDCLMKMFEIDSAEVYQDEDLPATSSPYRSDFLLDKDINRSSEPILSHDAHRTNGHHRSSTSTGAFDFVGLETCELEEAFDKISSRASDHPGPGRVCSLSDVLVRRSRRDVFLADLGVYCQKLSRQGQAEHDFGKNARNKTPAILDGKRMPVLMEPERQPVRSWEIGVLIPPLNALSTRLSYQYGDQVIDFFTRQDFKARLLHPLIEPPHVPTTTLAGRSSAILPPRINLRPLASLYFIGPVLFLWFLMWVSDFGYFRGFAWLSFLLFAWLVALAVVEPFREPARNRS